MLLGLVTFSLSMGCYLLLAGEIGATEVIAAVPVSCLVAAFAVLRHRGQDRSMRLRAPWFHLLLPPLAALLRDSLRVGVHLMRVVAVPRHRRDGSIDRQPFRAGGGDPADAGRRALATLAISFAPNGFVLDVAPSILLGDDHAMLVHHLVPSAPDPDMEWPT